MAIGLAEDARIVKQEVFGPVLHVAAFDDEAEAIAKANDTRYSLAASIWTENINRAHHRFAWVMRGSIHGKYAISQVRSKEPVNPASASNSGRQH